MRCAVEVLKNELSDAVEAGATEEYLSDIRAAIMVLNAHLFHKKIMGSDPNNEFYNASRD